MGGLRKLDPAGGVLMPRGETAAAIARAQSTTVKWMFGFWAPTAVGIVATAVGVGVLLFRH